MKTRLVFAATLCGFLASTAVPSLAQTPTATAGPTSSSKTQPNILVIMADDVGWMNVSSYGGDIMGVKTPNIDRIGRGRHPLDVVLRAA